MVTSTAAYALFVLSAVCLVTAWPQYRTSQQLASDSQDDIDRIVWNPEDRTYRKDRTYLSTPTNTARTIGNKQNTRRPQRLQGGFVLDHENDTRPQQRGGSGQSAGGIHADYARLQRRRQQQNSRAGDQSGRERTQQQQPESKQQEAARRISRMDVVLEETRDQANRTVGRYNSTIRGQPSQQASASQPRAHQAPSNQTGSATVSNEGRGMSETRTNGSSTRVKMPSESIVFPEANRNDPRRFVPRVEGSRPRCADKGDTFCTDALADYPVDYLNRFLEQQSIVFRNFFTTDVVPEANNIAQRFDDTQDDRPICLSEAHVVFPKVAQNKDDEWLFIVNLNQDEYKQGVRVEKCRNPDQPCAYSEGFPLSVQTFCKQKYIYRQMLAVTQDGTPKADSFKLPSCCACHTMSMGDAVSRMGIDPIKQTPAPTRRKRRR